MKILITVTIIFIITQNLSAQITDDIPGPERVLVVYNANSTVSDSIRRHYVRVRGIPESNVVPITLDSINQYGCEWGVGGAAAEEEIIGVTSEDAGWYYVKVKIANVIENYLNNTYYEGQPLSNVIRYIVLCKGIPLKVRHSINWIWDASNRNRVSVDALLCLINQPDGKSFVDLYGTPRGQFTNEYFNVDPQFTLEHRFQSNFYNSNGWYVQYLVSRLDGDNLDEVIELIERSYDPDMSGEKYWVLDDDPRVYSLSGNLIETHKRLNLLEYNLNPEVYVNSLDWIINNLPSEEEVIGYSSHGIHAGMPELYILNSLDFDYANGAIFNSWESFNGASFGFTRAGQGLISDFITMDGTGGVGNVYEPFVDGVGNDRIIFPGYALGYALVDAQYQGINYIAWQNVVVGDPLIRIYNPPANIVLQSDSTINSGNYYGKIIVPIGKTLTIPSGAVLNFKKNSTLKVEGNIIIEQGAELNFNSYSRFIINNVEFNEIAVVHFYDRSIMNVSNDLTLGENFALNLHDESKLNVLEDINFSIGSSIKAYNSSTVKIVNLINKNNISFYFYNSSGMIAENITLNDNSSINFLDNSFLQVNENLSLLDNTLIAHLSGLKCKNLYIEEGCTINFQLGDFVPDPVSGPSVTNEIIIEGSFNNPVAITFDDPEDNLFFTGSEDVFVDYCNFNSCGFRIISGTQVLNNINIKNSNFANSNTPLSIVKGQGSPGIGNVLLKKLVINSFYQTAVNIQNVSSLLIDSCSITEGVEGIRTDQVLNSVVSNNNLGQLTDGILINQPVTPPGIPESVPCTTYTISGNYIDAINSGIKMNGSLYYVINILKNIISISGNFSTGLDLNSANHYSFIKDNIYSGGEIGMLITNSVNVTVKGNDITNSHDGIQFSSVGNVECIANNIINNIPVKYSGIFWNSSSGNLRSNDISGYTYGIWIANSFPTLALNKIYSNLYNGIYIGEGSSPYMDQYFHQVQECNSLIYPFSGFNNIYENGGWTTFSEDDGSEIYFSNSFAFMDNGCNTVADDREPNPPTLYNTEILLNGSLMLNQTEPKNLPASYNYWGNNPLYGGNDPRNRFGLEVDYEPYLIEPCTSFDEESCLWIISDLGGNIIDTLYAVESADEGSEMEILYSQADNYFISNQLNEAKNIYNEIISEYGEDIESIKAYNKLLTIAVLQNQNTQELSQLRSLFVQSSSLTEDTLLNSMLKQLARLTLIANTEYSNAIAEFDGIVQQNPGTEKALYAEIDAYTTALLLDETGLGKSSKYYVVNTEDYHKKINTLRKSFMNGEYQSHSSYIPSEYMLFQNYPNPFNPTTVLRYDIPKQGLVSITVYNILGEKVKTLLNEIKSPGRYEVTFNAANLPSGVYIYSISTKDFYQAKKMMLIK